MLLAGIAVNALCGAGVGALVLFADDAQLRDLTFWTLGSLGGATWAVARRRRLRSCWPPWPHRRGLHVRSTRCSWASPRRATWASRPSASRRVAVRLAALAVAAVTAVAGLIGFVGLVAPHLVRLLLGPGHRALLPASALAGAVLLVAADLAGRTILAPLEVPIGIVTALAGAPFFLWLLLRDRPA